MADYIIRMQPTFSEYEEGIYLEFETEPPSTGHTGYTASQIRGAMNGSSTTPPTNPLNIAPGDRFRLWYGHTSQTTGAHNGTVVAQAALFTNDPSTIFNGSVEGTFGTWDVLPSTSGWYTVGSTTGNLQIRFSLEYTRGDGDYKSEYLWFNVAQNVVFPDTSITATWPAGTLASSATTFTVGIASGSSATTYSVRTGSYSGTVVGSRKGDGNISVSDTPAAGSTKTYYLTAHVEVADGGDGTVSNISANNVTKASEGSSESQSGGTADYGVEIFDSAGVKTMSVGDTVAFIVGTTTISVPNTGSTGTVTGTLTGLKTTDTLFAKVDTQDRHALEITITSAGNFSVAWTNVRGTTSGSSTYTLIGVNKGD